MVLSTPVKVVSGVAAASTAVAGSALVYKYATGLYAIEKVAIEEDNWSIKDPEAVGETDPKSLKVVVSLNKTNLNKDKYGIEQGTWECEIIASPTTTQNLDSNKKKLKNTLNTYFLGYASSATPRTIRISEEVRRGFVNNCSKNRTEEKHTDTKVASKVKISLSSLDEDLTNIFGGISNTVSLNSVEKKIHDETTSTITVGNLVVSSSSSPKKVTGDLKVANAGDTSGSWTCNIEGIPFTGTEDNVSDTSVLKTSLDEAVKKTEDKQGLIKSCARNRTSDVSATTVISTLKLNVSKESSGNKFKFDEGQWSSVLSGTWINLSV